MKSTDLDTAHQRIYSRILEMCVPIYCGGEDKRKERRDRKTRTGAEPDYRLICLFSLKGVIAMITDLDSS